MKLTQLTPFGLGVTEVDIGTVSSETIAELQQLLHVHGLLVFNNQDFSDEDQVRFASHLGKFTQLNHEDRQSLVYRFNNLEGVGKGIAPWHSDNAWTPYPLKYIMLFGDNVTTNGEPLVGGTTMLANAAAALHRLPSEVVTELESLECALSARRNPDDKTVRPCIEKHWATSTPYLVPNQLLTDYICDVSPERSQELLDQVFAALYDDAHVYTHEWSNGDFVLWDNRFIHHQRTAYDEAQNRVLRRCGIAHDAEPYAVTADEGPLESDTHLPTPPTDGRVVREGNSFRFVPEEELA
ncbi:MAG: TauD/TfdA family dioxygenase [bacterium]|nr:TauD/TfdA family dioxygenase [bacterium]